MLKKEQETELKKATNTKPLAKKENRKGYSAKSKKVVKKEEKTKKVKEKKRKSN